MLYVVVPAYNEAENLETLIPRIHGHVTKLDTDGKVLVVDDGSTDGTRSVMADLAVHHSGVSVVSSQRNRGKAAALKSGFTQALAGGATEIVMMDADGQDDPAELGRLLEALRDGADLVTGARIERHDRFVKRHTSRLYNKVTGVLSRAPGR